MIISRTASDNQTRHQTLPLVLLALCLATSAIGCQALYPRDSAGLASQYGTAEAETVLTTEHGAEVRRAIEDFESRWLSLEAHQDPSLQSELATGRYLGYWGYARMGARLYEEPFWLVTRSASVRKVEVLEYTPQRFKAIACVAQVIDETSTQAISRRFPWTYERRGVYVFVRASDRWKLFGFFNISIPGDVARDWSALPDWMKEIIGAAPTELDPECLAEIG